MTIAKQLEGKKVSHVGNGLWTDYDPRTLIYTFSDGSKAKQLTTYENCKPYITSCLSTLSVKPIKVWMAV